MKPYRPVLVSLAGCLFLLFASVANAQVAAYGMVALTAYGFSDYGESFRSASDNASLGGGAFYNFPIQSRLTAGIDGRILYSPSKNGGFAADAALRIGFAPHKNPMRPYFEVGGGLVSAVSNPGFDPQRFTNGAAEFLAGLDVRLTDAIDLRAIEFGATAGSSNSSTTSGVGFVDAGIVYHFRSAGHCGAPRHP